MTVHLLRLYDIHHRLCIEFRMRYSMLHWMRVPNHSICFSIHTMAFSYPKIDVQHLHEYAHRTYTTQSHQPHFATTVLEHVRRCLFEHMADFDPLSLHPYAVENYSFLSFPTISSISFLEHISHRIIQRILGIYFDNTTLNFPSCIEQLLVQK